MAASNESHRVQGIAQPAAAARPAPASAGPAEKLVNDLVLKAFRAGASDVHLEPNADHMLVRARIDGVLQTLDKVPGETMKQVVARLKIMSNLDANASNMPADGRFQFGRFDPTAKELDIRAAFMPTFAGEKAVLRLVDHGKLKLSFEDLGFGPESLRLYHSIVGRPSGLVLHVGPQGCGKTTAAYAALRNTPRPSASVVTVEETVEYVLPGVTQIQLNPDQGLTYAKALQGVLRQDPDVILVGELRDAETARVALDAAMSGRLVISTLHATNASGAVARLVELGFTRPQVAHALAGVVSQRLVRRLCSDCRERIAPSTLIRSALVLPPGASSVYRPKGCRKCGTKGFRGRVAILEVFNVTDRVREAIASGMTGQPLENLAQSEGTVPLLRDAVEKILQGATAVEEVLRSLCGVAVDDVSAITEPGDMVNFLKTVRDQFAPPGSAGAPAAERPGKKPMGSGSGSFPAAMLDEAPAAPAPPSRASLVLRPGPLEDPRPPSDRYRVAEPPPRLTQERSQEELLRSLMGSLPPEVAASIARAAASQASPAAPASTPLPGGPAPPGSTRALNPAEVVMRQLQELQRRLASQPPPRE